MWQYNYHSSDSLQHANRFQYIAKIKTPGGGSRYFYSQQEYQAYLKGSTNKAATALKSLTKPSLNTGVKSLTKRASTAANKSPRELQIERLASRYPQYKQQAVNTIAEKAVKPTLKKGRELDKKISKAVNNYPEYRERAVNTLAEKVVKPTMKKGKQVGETATDVVKNPGKYVNKAKKSLNNAVYNYPENYNRAVNTIADKAVKPAIQKGHELEAKVSDVVNNYPEYRNQVVKWLADNAATPLINWSQDKIERGKKLFKEWFSRPAQPRMKSTRTKPTSTRIKKEDYNPQSPSEDVRLIAPDVVQNASWDIERRLKRR